VGEKMAKNKNIPLWEITAENLLIFLLRAFVPLKSVPPPNYFLHNKALGQ
jgi:hypothetical protein